MLACEFHTTPTSSPPDLFRRSTASLSSPAVDSHDSSHDDVISAASSSHHTRSHLCCVYSCLLVDKLDVYLARWCPLGLLRHFVPAVTMVVRRITCKVICHTHYSQVCHHSLTNPHTSGRPSDSWSVTSRLCSTRSGCLRRRVCRGGLRSTCCCFFSSLVCPRRRYSPLT